MQGNRVKRVGQTEKPRGGQKTRAVRNGPRFCSRRRTCRRLWARLDPFNSFAGLGPGALARDCGHGAPFPTLMRVKYARTRFRTQSASKVDSDDTEPFVTASVVSDSTNERSPSRQFAFCIVQSHRDDSMRFFFFFFPRVGTRRAFQRGNDTSDTG